MNARGVHVDDGTEKEEMERNKEGESREGEQ